MVYDSLADDTSCSTTNVVAASAVVAAVVDGAGSVLYNRQYVKQSLSFWHCLEYSLTSRPSQYGSRAPLLVC